MPLDEFRVKYVYEEIMKEHNVPEMQPRSHEGIENMERLSLRKASRALPFSERAEIGKYADTLQEKLGIGRDGAFSVLARIGVLLNACR